MNRTKIEWTKTVHEDGSEENGFTWNPFTGCNRLCRDCTGKIYCWAYYMAQRQRGRNGYDKDEPFKPTFHLDKLLEPLQRKKPTKIH